MIFRKSIRWRIQVWHATLLLAMTLASGVTIWRMEKANELRRTDEELQSRLGVLTTVLERGGKRGGPPPEGPGGRDGPPGGRPRGEMKEDGPRGFGEPEVAALFGRGNKDFYFHIWTRRGTGLARSSNAPDDVAKPPVTEQAMGRIIRVRDGMRECYLFTPPGECILVGKSQAAVDARMREFGWKVAGAGAAVMLAGVLVGGWIVARELRPISRISTAATRVAEGNLDERIRTPETESELGKLAQVLDDTFERLDVSFERQARFTADAAHELRTPVSIILAQTQLALARERGVEEYRETIGITRRAALRMKDLTEALLQLSVLDARGEGAEREPCDLSVIAREQIQLTQVLAAEKDIGFVIELETAECECDAGQIGQLLLNLIANAIKFSPEGSRVSIATSMDETHASVAVKDEGMGIPAEHLPHLFERFYRVDSSRNRALGGAGLGLAICKQIAETHGGTLSVESRVGEGSVFTFTLPVRGSGGEK